MPCLLELDLSENEITTMKGLENLPNLKKLILKTNKMEAIDYVPDLPKLEHLDLGEN